MRAEDAHSKGLMRAGQKAKRDSLSKASCASCDSAIAKRVCLLEEFIGAKYILSYLSFGSEIETRAIIECAWELGKTVAAPRCVPKTRHMSWYCISSFESLTPNAFGIDEPAKESHKELHLASSCQALAIVPALAYDEEGFRLGYGGGYYDVFLAQFAGVSLGLCREAQMCSCLINRASYDIPVHLVVTEARTIRTAHQKGIDTLL